MAATVDNPIMDADKVREHLEAQRWPNGPICPHCSNADPDHIRAMRGNSHRKGVYSCKKRRDPFSVPVGTCFERLKTSLNQLVLATHLLCSSRRACRPIGFTLC